MSNLQQQKVEWTPEMQQKADRLRPRRTFADDLSEFMVTNPVARAYGLMLQGIADAGMNPAGYVARASGLDTRPLEPQNFHERALEAIPRTIYNAAMTKGLAMEFLPRLPLKSWGLTGRVPAGAGWGQKLGRKAVKVAKNVLNPKWGDLLKQSVGAAGMEALINPQTELGKFGANLLGASLMPGSNPLNLFRTVWQTAPATVAKKGVMGALKKGVKRLPKNRYARDFFENDLIGEGTKRVVSNLLDPRSPWYSKDMSLSDPVRLSTKNLDTVSPVHGGLGKQSAGSVLFGTNPLNGQNLQRANGYDRLAAGGSSAAARLYAGGSTNFGQYPAAENDSPFDQMCYGQSLMPRDYASPYASTTALYPRYPSARQAAFDTFLRFNQRGK